MIITHVQVSDHLNIGRYDACDDTFIFASLCENFYFQHQKAQKKKSNTKAMRRVWSIKSSKYFSKSVYVCWYFVLYFDFVFFAIIGAVFVVTVSISCVALYIRTCYWEFFCKVSWRHLFWLVFLLVYKLDSVIYWAFHLLSQSYSRHPVHLVPLHHTTTSFLSRQVNSQDALTGFCKTFLWIVSNFLVLISRMLISDCDEFTIPQLYWNIGAMSWFLAYFVSWGMFSELTSF